MSIACREFVELVTEYLENTLGPAETRAFEEHLEECPGCVEYLEEFRLIIRQTGQLREEDLSEQARATFLRAFDDWKASSEGPEVDTPPEFPR